MKRYLDNINRKISKLIKEISEEEQKELNKTLDENEKRKIKYISLYYKTVLNGCGFFSSDVSKCMSSMKEIDDEEAMLKYYEKDNYNDDGDIELEENPPLNMEVAEVYADEDIVLNENPPLNMEVAEVKVEEDIELEENPPLSMEVAEVENVTFDKESKSESSELFGNLKFEVAEVSEEFTFNSEEFKKNYMRERDRKKIDAQLETTPEINVTKVEERFENDIILEENPPLSMEVAEVYDEDDIVLNENPPLNMEVAEVYDEDDIVLNENPPLNMEVAEVYADEDIVLDENPPLNMEVEEVYDEDDIVLNENPLLNMDVADVASVEFGQKEDNN